LTILVPDKETAKAAREAPDIVLDSDDCQGRPVQRSHDRRVRAGAGITALLRTNSKNAC